MLELEKNLVKKGKDYAELYQLTDDLIIFLEKHPEDYINLREELKKIRNQTDLNLTYLVSSLNGLDTGIQYIRGESTEKTIKEE